MPHFCVPKKILKLIEKVSFFLSFMVHFDIYWIYDSFFSLLRNKLLKLSVWVFALKWHGFCRQASNQMAKNAAICEAREGGRNVERNFKGTSNAMRQYFCQLASVCNQTITTHKMTNTRNSNDDAQIKPNTLAYEISFHTPCERVCCVHFCTVLYIIKTKRSIKCNNSNTATKRAVLFTEVFFVLQHKYEPSIFLCAKCQYAVYFPSEKDP